MLRTKWRWTTARTVCLGDSSRAHEVAALGSILDYRLSLQAPKDSEPSGQKPLQRLIYRVEGFLRPGQARRIRH
jgi:hypothetical protein